MGLDLRIALVPLLGLVLAACGDPSATDPPSTGPPSTSRPSTSRPSTSPPSTSSSTPVPGITRLDIDDSGRSVTLEVGKTASITLAGPALNWSGPKVEGDAVRVSEDISDAATGVRTWTVTAVRTGTAVVTVAGSPTCRTATPPCASPDQLWTARFSVP
jgi:hypothetical protein